MSRQSFLVHALLASAALVSACTTDFTGYHLLTNTGHGGTSASAGSTNDAGALSQGGDGGSAGGPSGVAGSDKNGEAGAAGASGAGATETQSGGAAGSDPVEPPNTAPRSCDGLENTCGPDHNANCCDASELPGGTYDRSNKPGSSATVSPFALDIYEISVGRVRKFLAAYSQTMTRAGSGRNAANPDLDPGWNTAWNAKLPATATAFSTALLCSNGTFTAAPGQNESLPATCLSWYEADAFCIWDGGRLPTEAEWNYAAAGGDEQRVHPWGAAVPDNTYAVFCPDSCGKVQAVGSRANGNGKWGQADLVGNAWEWNLDVFANPYAQTSCLDCANTAATSSSLRAFRGGSAGNDASYLLTSTRSSRDPSDHNGFVGARCARNL